MKRIVTRDENGQANGWLMTMWSAAEDESLRPDQVYLTAIAPGCEKGPHLHMMREQRYYVIRGVVEVIWREDDEIDTSFSGGQSAFLPVYKYGRLLMKAGEGPQVVPAGVPSQLRNMGPEEAWIINMPAPAWTADNPDEWPVEGWNPTC